MLVPFLIFKEKLPFSIKSCNFRTFFSEISRLSLVGALDEERLKFVMKVPGHV